MKYKKKSELEILIDVALFARAWIEIYPRARFSNACSVALFARAWIEIKHRKRNPRCAGSRPLCEGVD